MNILIVEDEAMARENLSRTLSATFPDMVIVAKTDSVQGTVEFLKRTELKIDIIFMDVELADGVCFEIFRQTEVKAKVIMTTAYDNYAIKAFEAGSVDYLLKPVEQQALVRAVSRCRSRQENIDIDALIGAIRGEGKKERFIVSFNDRIVPVETSQIAYFYSEDKCNYLRTFSGISYVVDLSMDDIDAQTPGTFFKISRSCIVSMKAIKSITKQIGGRLRIDAIPESHFEMTVSRSRVDEFLEWLQK